MEVQSQSLRSSFNMVLARYKKIKKGNIRLTQSELVLQVPISTTQAFYRFPVLENEGQTNAIPEEIRLNINDEFIVTHLGFYLGAALRGEDVKEQNEYLTSPPMELTFRMANLLPAYKGFLKIDVNNVNYIDKWHLKKHQRYNRTQFSNFVPAPGQPMGTAPSISYDEAGIFAVEPHILLSGAKKNDITITLPEAIGATPTISWTVDQTGGKLDVTVNKLFLIVRGFLAQNGAKFQQ